MQAGHQLLPPGVEVEHGVPVRPGHGLQALHPQDDVLQGALRLTELRVGHPGVDDDHVVEGHGEGVVLGQEFSVAVGDEKQLGAAVGMEAGAPLLRVVLVPGDIGQARRAAGRRRRQFGETVLKAVQKSSLPLRNFVKIYKTAYSLPSIIHLSAPLCNPSSPRGSSPVFLAGSPNLCRRGWRNRSCSSGQTGRVLDNPPKRRKQYL